jgi:Mg2+ and Co2+ transporter CorA
MITQAIIDAMIDLAIPVISTYQDVIGELEIDVLTEPDMAHVSGLYILMSEITSMRNLVLPIVNLINSLRDHKVTIGDVGTAEAQRAASTVKISPMAQTYFADVEDHCLLITQSLDQMRRSADGMIDLIFNTISALQNESMKQLTTVTIIFLPMTFITGYFGMNFHQFGSLNNDEAFFWSIAAPVAIGTIILLMRGWVYRWFVKTMQKRGISKNRRRRLKRETEQRRDE